MENSILEEIKNELKFMNEMAVFKLRQEYGLVEEFSEIIKKQIKKTGKQSYK